MFQTFAFYSTAFYREFSAYTARVLQGIGLNYGALFPLIYVGKHPGCTPSQLVHALGLDWGYGQRNHCKPHFLWRGNAEKPNHLFADLTRKKSG